MSGRALRSRCHPREEGLGAPRSVLSVPRPSLLDWSLQSHLLEPERPFLLKSPETWLTKGWLQVENLDERRPPTSAGPSLLSLPPEIKLHIVELACEEVIQPILMPFRCDVKSSRLNTITGLLLSCKELSQMAQALVWSVCSPLRRRTGVLLILD